MTRSRNIRRWKRTPPHSLLAVVALLAASLPAAAQEDRPPNIIYILADDLGWGELGCYGQKKIRTPNLDRMASEGMRFTRHYAGAPVCAPARCVLLSGHELARAEIRGNKEVQPEGQWPISADSLLLPAFLRGAGYATGAMGKWGLGPVGSSGDPNDHGFDLFFGYNCQRQAHNLYPDHLWLNAERYPLDNPRFSPHQKLVEAPDSFARFRGDQYAPELIAKMSLAFLREHAAEPFFLYAPFVEPHVALQPLDEWLERYPTEWDEEPYLGTRGYLPHPRPHAAYAALISQLDDHVGKILDLVDELGIADRTLILFSSDNGPTHDVGGVDTEFFESTGGLRGRKGSVFEGGLRVPMIARWPGHVPAGTTTEFVSGFQDVFPTIADVAQLEAPEGLDGESLLPVLLGEDPGERAHPLVWEFFEYGGQRAVIDGRYKAVQRHIRRDGASAALEVFDLEADPHEEHDLAAERPELTARLRSILARECVPNPLFPLEPIEE
ncbi:MAG TPA: hypothetical protein ENJ09_07365 [Planctomycetes bacterium]|nr:hypothetical protein [Planctomycetota bacterium]